MQERDGDISFLDFAPVFLGRQRWVVVQLVLTFCLSALNSRAQGHTTETWTGKAANSLWSDSQNWSPRGVPGSNDTAIIDLSGSNFVILDTNLVIGSIDLGGDGTNILELPGVSIQCTGSISISSNGFLDIMSNSVVVGGWVQNSGTIMVPANLGTQSLTLTCLFTNYGVLDAETNSTLSLPGTSSFTPELLAGTAFNGSGAVEFLGGGYLHCSGNITVNGTVQYQGQAAIFGPSTWTGPGLFRWLNGVIDNVDFASDFHVEIDGSSWKFVTGTCTNQGSVRWLASATSVGNAGTNGLFYNLGLFQIEGNCQLGSQFPSFQNAGIIHVPADLGELSMTIGSGFTNSGAIDVDADSVLDVVAAPYFATIPDFQSGTVFTGLGAVQFPSAGASAIWNGVCTNQCTIRCLGTNAFSDTTTNFQFYNSGLFQIEKNCQFGPGGSFQNSGTIDIPAGLGKLLLATYSCNFTNYGAIDVESNSTLDMGGLANIEFESGTIFSGPGTVDLGFSQFGCNGQITANGIVVFTGNQKGNVIWSGPGLLQFEGGSMENVTFSTGFRVETADQFMTVAGICTNQGTISWMGAGGLAEDATQGNTAIYNEGLFLLETNCTLSGLAGYYNTNTMIFQNTGTIKIPANLGNLSLALNFTFTNYGVIDVETNSTLDFPGEAPRTFESGTVFSGPGTIGFNGLGPAGIFCNGQITANGIVIFDTFQSGNVIWTGPGLLQFINGAMNSVTFGPDFHVEVFGSGVKTLIGACTNHGTIRLLDIGYLTTDPVTASNSSFWNEGILQVETNCGLSTFPIFDNTGTIRVPPGLSEISMANYCNFTNRGVIEVDSNSILDIPATNYGATATFESGTVFTGPGIARTFGALGSVSYDGGITANGTVELNSDGIGNGITIWSGSGLLRWLSGRLDTITFSPGFHTEIAGNNTIFTSACTNQGTIRWWRGNSLNDPLTSGEFYNSGLIQIETNSVWYNTAIDNEPSGTFRQLAGQFSVQSITNCGTVDLRSGTLNVSGNFFSGSNSTYELTLSGTTPGTNFNQLTAQSLALNGALQVAFSNGFAPANGSSFTIANDSSQSGTFASLTQPIIPPTLALNVAYSPTTMILDVVPAFFGLTNSVYTNGSFQFSLNGNPAGSYDIQASSNLTDWTTVGTNSPFTGSVNFTDTNAASPGQRFYRARIFP